MSSTTPALAAVFSGSAAWDDAARDGAITVVGPPALVRAVPTWFRWSLFRDAHKARGRRAAAAAAG